MRVLVLGGTSFVGRHFTEAALAAGHALTLFNRGRTNPGLFPSAERLAGDRAKDLSPLAGRTWDAVVDTCGYRPEVVGASAEALRGRAGRYLFVSTVSVYRDWGAGDETAPLAEPPSGPPAAWGPEAYGALKAACEEAVRAVFGAAALIVRPGLVGGPHDPTDRLTYWPMRAARGGEVLAPGDPGRRVQVIDARDLGAWLLRALGNGVSGTFNACGRPTPMRELLALCREVTGSDAAFTWADAAFLERAGAAPWTSLPLWIPGVDDAVSDAAARRLGLSTRPLSDTVRDAWVQRRGDPAPLRAGLSPESEAALLAAWHGRRTEEASR